MKNKLVIVVSIIAAFAGIIYVLNKNKEKNKEHTEVVAQKNSAVMVRSVAAGNKELSSQFTANGTFAAKQEVKLSAETPGRVISVFVKEGDAVKPGQVLAVIKGDKLNVGVTNAQAVYNNALSELSRFESAYATGGVTKQQLDQVKLQLENAKNNLRSAQISANDANITASFHGIVNSKNIEPGLYVNPGQELFEIVNVSSLKLKVNIDEKNISQISLGQEVEIKSSVITDKVFSGKITFIAPKADQSLNFPVEIEIKNNSKNDLKAGMYGTAHFGNNEKVNVFAVPRNAFVGSISNGEIFVINKDNTVKLVKVTIGRNFGDDIEILSGINKGDLLVVSGQINLMDGTAVQIIK